MSLDDTIARHRLQRRLFLLLILIPLAQPFATDAWYMFKDAYWRPSTTEIAESVLQHASVSALRHPRADLQCFDGYSRWEYVCTYAAAPDITAERRVLGIELKRGRVDQIVPLMPPPARPAPRARATPAQRSNR
jgi:hypothetical protein